MQLYNIIVKRLSLLIINRIGLLVVMIQQTHTLHRVNDNALLYR